MLVLRPSKERGHYKNAWLDSYHTFSFGSYHDPDHLQFGALRVINQDVIDVDRGFDFHGHKDMEIFTYVLSGTLEHQDNMGNKEKIRPGEVQIMSAGTGVLHSEYNPSSDEKVELLQIWVIPDQFGIAPRYAQKKFSENEKLNHFKLIISPDEEGESLKIFQKAWVWSSLFSSGFEKSFPIQKGKKLWLHMASGEIEVDGQKLVKGDGLAVQDQELINIKGLATKSEFIILELV